MTNLKKKTLEFGADIEVWQGKIAQNWKFETNQGCNWEKSQIEWLNWTLPKQLCFGYYSFFSSFQLEKTT
jgi:hypothetical protein